MKQCIKCLQFKEETEFYKTPPYKGKQYLRGECKICNTEIRRNEKYKEVAKKRRQTEEFKQKRKAYKQLEHVKEYNKQYEASRQPKRKEQKRIRHNYRYNNDILYKLSHLCRVRLKELLKIKGWTKSNTFAQYIGCTKEELMKHIESQFKDTMSWDLLFEGKIHIDHIIPLSSAKTEEELYKLCHYTNLQPLWVIDNLKKSNKIE